MKISIENSKEKRKGEERRWKTRERNLIKFLKCKNCSVKCCAYKRVSVFIKRVVIKRMLALNYNWKPLIKSLKDLLKMLLGH